MAGCLALLSNPGPSGSVAIDLADATSIRCDGSPSSGFVAAGMICVGGSTTGAGCSTLADCGRGASACAVQGGSRLPFAFDPDGTFTLVGAARPGRVGVAIEGCSFYLNQVPQWGVCRNAGAEQGRACRASCSSPSSGATLDGPVCDEDADCRAGDVCRGKETCPGTDRCTGEGIWPAGHGAIRALDLERIERAAVRNNTFYDAGRADQLIAVGDHGEVAGNFTQMRSGPVAPSLRGNSFPVATQPEINRTIIAGADAAVERNDARGRVAAVAAGARSSVVDNYVVESATDATGIAIDGPDARVASNYLNMAGAKAIGIAVVRGRAARVQDNTVVMADRNGIGSAIQIGGWNANVSGNLWQISGGTAGIYVKSGVSGTVVTGNAGVGIGTTWGQHVKLAGSQTVIADNYFGGDNCVGNSQTAGDPPAINYVISGNRCFAPTNYGAQILTGAVATGNYFAWCRSDSCVPLLIGDSGRQITSACVAEGKPYACCSGAKEGICETGYGGSAGHFVVSGNMLHTAARGASLLKFANVGRRCHAQPSPFPNDCSGAAGARLRGEACPCAQDSDCRGSDMEGDRVARCQPSAGDTIGTVSGNVLMSSQGDEVGIDLSLDNDAYGAGDGRAAGATDGGTTMVEGISFSGNAISLGPGSVGVRFSPDQGRRADLRRLSFTGNAFGETLAQRFANWKWTFGTKDDVPVAVLHGGSSGDVSPTKTAYFPVVGQGTFDSAAADHRALAGSGGTAFQATCSASAAPDNGPDAQSYRITLMRNGTEATTPSCAIEEGARDCAMAPSLGEVDFAGSDSWSWKVEPSGHPVPAAIACQLLFESKDLTPW